VSDESGIWVDGKCYTDDDLTFREQRTIRSLLRELMEDPLFDPLDAAQADLMPAYVCVIKRRTDPGYTVEQALDIKPSDLAKPEKKARPTRAGS
jgi:hypothetical protein